MKTIKLNYDKISELLREEILRMYSFSWSGWGVDILLNIETEEFFSSNINTNNVYLDKDIIVLATITSWYIEEYDDIRCLERNIEDLKQEEKIDTLKLKEKEKELQDLIEEAKEIEADNLVNYYIKEIETIYTGKEEDFKIEIE